MNKEKMEREIERGDIIYTGAEKLELAKQGKAISMPKPIVLREKKGDTRSRFEKDNQLFPKGDIIE